MLLNVYRRVHMRTNSYRTLFLIIYYANYKDLLGILVMVEVVLLEIPKVTTEKAFLASSNAHGPAHASNLDVLIAGMYIINTLSYIFLGNRGSNVTA